MQFKYMIYLHEYSITGLLRLRNERKYINLDFWRISVRQ